ncbi:unnamed protein product, partial [Phaeothamnion confervicola]
MAFSRDLHRTSYCRAFSCQVLELAALDDIDTGLATGLTYAEYAQQFKDSYIERRVDKLRSKFPNGESYMDVFRRLEPLLLDLLAEQRPVV